MNLKARWTVTIAASLATLPAGYAAASLISCTPSAIGRLIVLANALTLIP